MELINNKDYLLLINEEETINKGDLCYSADLMDESELHICVIPDNCKNLCNKVIAYYPIIETAKELNLPLLPNPFKSIDIWEKGKESYQKFKSLNGDHYHSNSYLNGFNEAYTSIESKQFSLDDVKKLFKDYFKWCIEGNATLINTALMDVNINRFFDIFESQIQNQLPKEFIPEYKIEYETVQFIDNKDLTKTFFKGIEYDNLSKDIGVTVRDSNGKIWTFPTYKRFEIIKPKIKELKIIKNSEGKQELLGNYKY